MENEKKIINLIESFYGIISGKAGQPRDWSKFKSLFINEAKLIPHSYDLGTAVISAPYDIDNYISNLSGFLATNDFYENGCNYDVSIYNNLAQVYSEYETKPEVGSNEVSRRGIKLIQLLQRDNEWKIASMVWQDIN